MRKKSEMQPTTANASPHAVVAGDWCPDGGPRILHEEDARDLLGGLQ